MKSYEVEYKYTRDLMALSHPTNVIHTISRDKNSALSESVTISRITASRLWCQHCNNDYNDGDTTRLFISRDRRDTREIYPREGVCRDVLDAQDQMQHRRLMGRECCDSDYGELQQYGRWRAFRHLLSLDLEKQVVSGDTIGWDFIFLGLGCAQFEGGISLSGFFVYSLSVVDTFVGTHDIMYNMRAIVTAHSHWYFFMLMGQSLEDDQVEEATWHGVDAPGVWGRGEGGNNSERYEKSARRYILIGEWTEVVYMWSIDEVSVRWCYEWDNRYSIENKSGESQLSQSQEERFLYRTEHHTHEVSCEVWIEESGRYIGGLLWESFNHIAGGVLVGCVKCLLRGDGSSDRVFEYGFVGWTADVLLRWVWDMLTDDMLSVANVGDGGGWWGMVVHVKHHMGSWTSLCGVVRTAYGFHGGSRWGSGRRRRLCDAGCVYMRCCYILYGWMTRGVDWIGDITGEVGVVLLCWGLDGVEQDDEKEELKRYLDIVLREDVAVDVEYLSTKYPIVDWKTYTLSENFMYYKIIRGDGSSKNYKILSEISHSADAKWNCHTYAYRKEVSSKSRNDIKDAEIDQGLGSTSGIRACALRNFDLEVMELENTQNNALAKLPMLKLGEYEMWEIRIKQYFQIQDYALWEVIENGNSWVPIPVTTPPETGTSTTTKMTVPATIEEKTCKKNDVKARSLLLMALPNEHQLTFDQYVDAQSMFAAIKARFGGNEATKKTQKALLKQQYENFSASSSESLDSIFNRLQKLVSRLAILGVVTPPEDLNVKFLRSLPSEWDTHVVVWMNKPDFDTMGLDDLYNNFKIVEQKVKKSAGASNDDKNLAFVTTSGASSTNNINTVNPEVSTATTKVNTASTQPRRVWHRFLSWGQ
ncbi:hypothetical protein Tco_1370358 [Tanacetum coccineum]